jgi:5-formyltetrahydrofolate cyclo-ligase
LTDGEAKRALRAELAAVRAGLAPAERAERSLAVADRIEGLGPFRAARTVAVYAALGPEVDPAPIVARAAARGVCLVYPRAAGRERVLAFAACGPGDLVRGPFGALEPPAAAPGVPLDEIDCVLMPGLAFSEDGLRLGRGGGHFDATLSRMPRALRVGLAFDVQVVRSLPREPHDAALDALVTDVRLLRFARESR